MHKRKLAKLVHLSRHHNLAYPKKVLCATEQMGGPFLHPVHLTAMKDNNGQSCVLSKQEAADRGACPVLC